MQVDANGTRLWFDVEGAALVPDGNEMRKRPTAVLLHGGPGSFDHSCFKPEFARLADVAQVIYLDLPGHGRSEWGDPHAWSFEGAADAVRDFCGSLGIAAPIVYGHSLGAMVALVYGARHPGHASALVIQSGMARVDVDRIVEDFRRIGGDDIAGIARRVYGGDSNSVTPDEWTPCWRLFGPWVPIEERKRTVMNVELNSPGLELMQSFDVRDELGAIECPALVCTGELDPITPPDTAREIAAGIRSARLEILDGAGHFPWMDVPEAYWPLISDFVLSAASRDAATS
jgi:pimeloyl-ACP methyl ester carboxylesterase